jgi:ParB family transcriptional regulator, chromosome partitioning protein
VSKPGKGLGKGFDSLIPTNFDPSLLLDSKDRIQKLFITAVKPDINQPRRHFDETALKELSVSIKRFGILQPLIVIPLQDNTYQIIAGERRWRAAQLAGLTQVPVIVREPAELEQLEIALIENVQRVDLSPLEQAVSIERLHQQFNLTYQQIAERLGKAVTTVNNIVRLLQLPPDAREALQQGEISEGHARAILSLKDEPTKQAELLSLIVKNSWSVRQAEQFVVAHKTGAETITEAKQRMATETPATKKLAEQLQTKVSLKHTARGGRLEIHFKTPEELEQLLSRFRQL